MDFMELCKTRRSVRSFKRQDLPEGAIISLLEAAVSAPSGGNRQPWHFYVIRKKEVILELFEKAIPQDFVASVPVVIVVCADIKRSESRYGERGRTLYCLQDTAAAVQNLLLGAKSLGLGACWCGAFDEPAVASLLNIPREVRPVALIPVGYPAAEPTAPKRRPLSECVTWVGEAAEHEPGPEPGRIVVEHCDMSGALFNDVNLASAEFCNINMRSVRFSDINMEDASFDGLNLNRSHFGCVDMKEAVFTKPQLAGAVFTDCDLNGVQLNGCKTDGLKIDGELLADLIKK